MATRSIPTTTTLDPAKLLSELIEFGSTEDNPTTTKEMAGEFNVEPKAMLDALGKMEDAGQIISAGRGLECVWWVEESKPEKTEEAPKVKRTRRTKAQMDAAKAEERKRLEYAVKAAESQDAVMSQAPEFTGKDETPVIAAVEPIQGADGENITVPVSEDSTERRELDASKGERLLSEESMRDVVASLTSSQDTEEYPESKIPEYEGPESIPATPEGVTPNFWYMAHYAITDTARAYWRRVVQNEQYDYAQHFGTPAPVSALTDAQREECGF